MTETNVKLQIQITKGLDRWLQPIFLRKREYMTKEIIDTILAVGMLIAVVWVSKNWE